VFVCENNKYGMGTSAERSSQNTAFFTRGDQIPGIQVGRNRCAASTLCRADPVRPSIGLFQVNGMDILAVHQACKFAKEWTTTGKGPLVVEFVTYRYGGHS
jgi:pyruvate dehydrogenase E1 component alpha subunit